MGTPGAQFRYRSPAIQWVAVACKSRRCSRQSRQLNPAQCAQMAFTQGCQLDPSSLPHPITCLLTHGRAAESRASSGRSWAVAAASPRVRISLQARAI
eukprot:5400866-Alexandrium_andersonii.AAC.1